MRSLLYVDDSTSPLVGRLIVRRIPTAPLKSICHLHRILPHYILTRFPETAVYIRLANMATSQRHRSLKTAEGPRPRNDRRDSAREESIRIGLTPTNTWAHHTASFGIESTDIAENLDLSDPPTSLLTAVDEHLKDFVDTLQPINENLPVEYKSDPEDYNESKPHWYLSPGADRERSPILPRSSHASHHRSSSVPVKPLKSALATSLSNSPPELDTVLPKKKKAHFVDDPSASGLSLQRVTSAPADARRASAPTHTVYPPPL
ncbi:hypothetical protein M433DRAFT_352043 [Acidomyces richmondensis BFW]|nr:MAG: hypothetical protein FE78DRAFT_484183 [Acidomyces sp. 'richmondensis']KYG43514.1 hypothetical protein M433DRAFT_352043 [Acidomyces richmondensis BFW]